MISVSKHSILTDHLIVSQISLKTWRNEPQMLVLQKIGTTQFQQISQKTPTRMHMFIHWAFPSPTPTPDAHSPYLPQIRQTNANAQNSLSSDHPHLSHITKSPTAQTTAKTIPNLEGNQRQIHSAKTHHLALLSASTSPLQTPRSPTLIIVSQVPPSPLSIA